jgi:hypothetical protein
MNNDVIVRLAAANPLPTAAPPRHPEPLVVPTRRIVLALALIAAVALPAAAGAGKRGDLLQPGHTGRDELARPVQRHRPRRGDATACLPLGNAPAWQEERGQLLRGTPG